MDVESEATAAPTTHIKTEPAGAQFFQLSILIPERWIGKECISARARGYRIENSCSRPLQGESDTNVKRQLLTAAAWRCGGNFSGAHATEKKRFLITAHTHTVAVCIFTELSYLMLGVSHEKHK
jgi:hypothetical protein